MYLMIRNFFKINQIIFKRNFSLDRKLPQIIYLESSLNNEKQKIGIKSEKKEDEIKIDKNDIKIKKRESSQGDLLHLLPKN